MSDSETKFKRSKRLSAEETSIARQFKIAKQHFLVKNQREWQAGRYAEQRAVDCGNTRCIVCGNPRRIWNEKTIQELWQEQAVTNDFGD